MFQTLNNGVCAPKGFRATGIRAGINPHLFVKDLSLILSDVRCVAASIYTKNKIKGSPVRLSQSHLQDGHAQAILCNSSIAITCDKNAMELSSEIINSCADTLGIRSSDIIFASTGTINQRLDVNTITSNMQQLKNQLSTSGSLQACEAIMTQDSIKKQYAIRFKINDKVCHIGAIAKGCGVLNPNVSTILTFLTSDVSISNEMLEKALTYVSSKTFDMLSMGEESGTNDMMSMLCNGLARNPTIIAVDENYHIFVDALLDVCKQICKQIISDTHTSTKLLTCEVINALDEQLAVNIAKAVIQSHSFKTSISENEANWYRILCAIGNIDIDYDEFIEHIDVYIQSHKGSIQVCKQGSGILISEEKAQNVLQSKEVQVIINLHEGTHDAIAWGSDSTYKKS